MEFLIAAFFLYLLIGAGIAIPIFWFGRNRIIFNKHELIICILPFLIYTGIHSIAPGKGGGANFAVESMMMAILIPMATALRLFKTTAYQRNMVNFALLVIAIGIALGMRLFFPVLQD